MSRQKIYEEGLAAGIAAGKEELANLVIRVYGLSYTREYRNFLYYVDSTPKYVPLERDLKKIVAQADAKAKRAAEDAVVRGTDAEYKAARKNLGLDK